MRTRSLPAPPGEQPAAPSPAPVTTRAWLAHVLGRAFPELKPPLDAFGRLAVTHMLMVTGDAFMTVALAGSLFFSISPSAAASKVALYLGLSVAPFAVVAPALGPLLDRSRGARRAMVMIAGAARVVLCLLMARDLHSLLLFPEAFLVLVASKLYLVGKAALVPATVGSGPELLRANSRLALIAGLGGLVGGVPAAIILKIPFLGAPWVLRADAVVLALATVSAARLRKPAQPADTATPEDAPEADTKPAAAWRRTRLRAMPPTVLVASTAMAVLRGAVGLITFLLAFELRRQHAATWWFGVVLVASVGGSLLATLVTPVLRRVLREENIILGALVLVAAGGAAALVMGGRGAACLLASAIGLAAGAAKVAFDSMVQRDVDETARGRAFARFETRFQLAWVLGALIPVGISLSNGPGEILVAVAAAAAAVVYTAGRRAASRVAGDHA
ncbi:MAG TPA: MFS transporter [Acidimicrobiales bacterium]|nr:MFS transporter [Acidimicrobiales bacterium]